MQPVQPVQATSFHPTSPTRRSRAFSYQNATKAAYRPELAFAKLRYNWEVVPASWLACSAVRSRPFGVSTTSTLRRGRRGNALRGYLSITLRLVCKWLTLLIYISWNAHCSSFQPLSTPHGGTKSKYSSPKSDDEGAAELRSCGDGRKKQSIKGSTSCGIQTAWQQGCSSKAKDQDPQQRVGAPLATSGPTVAAGLPRRKEIFAKGWKKFRPMGTLY